jgi:hypothetical protein
MSISATAILETSAKRLFPDKTVEQVFAQLLLERAQKNLIKYHSMARQFEVKYDQSFDAFRQKILNAQPAFEIEQDYFDWELAITGIADMEKEIERLQNLGEQ